MKKHRFFIGFIIFAVTAIMAGYGYGPVASSANDLDNLQYTEGQFDYYSTKRKWKNKRKGDQPFRKYLFIYLEDDLARYEDSKFLLGNLQQNALLMVFHQWPRENIEIGYMETDDSGLREIYDIKYEGESLVNLNGIRKDIENEALMLMIFTIVAGVFSLLSLTMYILKMKKQKSISD